MTLPLLQEKAREEFNKFGMHQVDGLPVNGWPEMKTEIGKYLDQTIEETWNAAITEAIRALPELKNNKEWDGLARAAQDWHNSGIIESRARLEALLKV